MMRGSAPAVRSLIYSEICPMPTSRTGNWPAIRAILLIKVISLFVLLVVWLGGEIQKIIFYLGWAATRTTASSFLLGVLRVILWFPTKTGRTSLAAGVSKIRRIVDLISCNLWSEADTVACTKVIVGTAKLKLDRNCHTLSWNQDW